MKHCGWIIDRRTAAAAILHATPEQRVQALALTVLYALPALLCVHIAFVSDPDIWWHLRTGEWIQQHLSVPHTDSFSAPGSGKPWAAYSWLFDLLLLRLFQQFGLAGIVAYSSVMVLAITVALHHLIRRLQPDFHTALLLTLVACFGIASSYSPRPWLFSILFFVAEVDILMHARRTGTVRELAYLPALFALWANVHVQFVDGLVVLAIACADSALTHRGSGPAARVAPRWLCAAFIACVLATLLNPYGWHIYKIAYDLAAQPGVLKAIAELQSLPFRGVSDYCILFLAMGAAAALARSRGFRLFETAALMFAAVVAFRSMRDAWIMATIGCAIVSAGLSGDDIIPHRLPASATPLIALAAGVLVFLGFNIMHVTNERLQTQLAQDLPVHAVEFVKSKDYRGPLFNDYNWGGYLIWALRLPVSIDGRASLHGDKQMDRSFATWSAEPDWASDPLLQSAELVIGPVKGPLIQILRLDRRFDLVFEDKLAAVFAAHR